MIEFALLCERAIKLKALYYTNKEKRLRTNVGNNYIYKDTFDLRIKVGNVCRAVASSSKSLGTFSCCL